MKENQDNINQQSYQAIIYSSNGNSINMRAQPSFSGEILYTLSPNTPILVVKKLNEWWSKVQYNQTSGFIMNKFLIKKDFDLNLLTLNKKQKLIEAKNKIQEALEAIQLILNQ